MNIRISDMAFLKKVRRGSYCRAGISAAVIVLCAMNIQAQPRGHWAGASATTPPGAGQEWSAGFNWTAGIAPSGGANVYLWRGASGAANVLVDATTNPVSRVDIRNGSNLLVVPGGHLRSSQIEFPKGVLAMTGGEITLRTGTGASDALSLMGGSYVQSGGAFLASDIQFRAGGTIQVSGGTMIAENISSGLWFRGGSGRFEVRGAGASITLGGFRHDPSSARATFAFVLHNNGAHISKITFANNGMHGAALRTHASLEVSLAGGVLLTGSDSHTLIQRVSGADAAWRNNASLTRLWEDRTTGGKARIDIGLRSAADRGDLDATADTPLVFSESLKFGYIDLVKMHLLEKGPFRLALDISGGTLSNLTDALDEAGIAWAPGTADYEVVLELHSSVSGNRYFAWDFDKIDADMGIQGIALHTIPEPSIYAGAAVVGP